MKRLLIISFVISLLQWFFGLSLALAQNSNLPLVVFVQSNGLEWYENFISYPNRIDFGTYVKNIGGAGTVSVTADAGHNSETTQFEVQANINSSVDVYYSGNIIYGTSQQVTYEVDISIGNSTFSHVFSPTGPPLLPPSPYAGKYEGFSPTSLDSIRMSNGVITSVGDKKPIAQVPNEIVLNQNYPNPFNPMTNIPFTLSSRSFVLLKVFDLLGKEVATIVSEEMSAGNYSQQWNASNLSSGIYFYRLQAGSLMETKKLVLLK